MRLQKRNKKSKIFCISVKNSKITVKNYFIKLKIVKLTIIFDENRLLTQNRAYGTL